MAPILSCKHETRSEASVVMYVTRWNKFSQAVISSWETYWLGHDNQNTDMYLDILGCSAFLAHIFLERYGEKLYRGPDFRKAMANRI